MKRRRFNTRRLGEFDPRPDPVVIARIAGPEGSDLEDALAHATTAEHEDGLLLIEHEQEALLDVKAANRAWKDQLEAGFGEDDSQPE